MREIKFRGISDDEWVYGMLLKTEEDDFGEHGNEHFDYLIQTEEDKEFERAKYYITDNETIGQLTGLHDKNGKEIYEGDIVEITRPCILERGEVKFINGCFVIKSKDTLLMLYQCEINNFKLKVIGNIFDNPDLLEKEGVKDEQSR